MALDLPAIVQAPEQAPQAPDMAKTYLAAQQINQGNLAAQHAAALPGDVQAYQSGDQGALAQIYADNPEVANSIQNLALRKQEVNQEGALQATEIAGQKQAQASAAIDLQMKQRDQQLQRTQMQGLAAQSALQTVTDMRNAKADPSQIQKVVKQLHDQYNETTGETAHPELSDYNADPDMWIKNMSTIVQHGQMASDIRAKMNMTPEERAFAQFKSMSPEDKQNYLALQAKNPFMLTSQAGASSAGGSGAAPAGAVQPPIQGPTVTGQPVQAPASGAGAAKPVRNAAVDENVDLSKDTLDTINGYQGDPRIKTMAKNMLLAQQPAPNLTTRTPPDVKEAYELAQQADPSFSNMSYPTKLKITNAFLDGPEAKNNVAIQTVIHHLGRMADNDKNLSSSGSDLLNAVYNDVAPHLSDKAKANLNDYKIDQTAVGTEAAKAYKGVGALSQEEQKDWGDRLNANNGPEARAAARKEIGQLAMGKIQALQDQWKQAYPNSTRSFFTPKTISTLNRLGVDTSDIQTPAAPKPSASPSSAGGVLHVDKNGNKAMVYPDGHFEEVK